MAIEPNETQYAANLTGDRRETPIIAMNLLKYRKEAAYPSDWTGPRGSGRDAYGRYGMVAVATFTRLGATIVAAGPVEGVFIGEAQDEGWDDFVAVRYPSRRAFEAMLADPAYAATHIHRQAGLEKSIVLFCGAAFVAGS
jgi:uncharacterized protein (DUF1330 family)